MTQTIDRAGRPEGHPGYCACPECFEWYQQKNPAASPTPSGLVLTPAEQTADYARRIHWWVRLFGIIWIVIPVVVSILAVFFAVGIMTRTTVETGSSYDRCVATGSFSVTECARMYPR